MMAAVVRMPQVATGAAEAAIQAWLVDVGDAVALGQSMVEIETEKAVVEYEAEAEGTLAGILVPAGDPVAVGTPIAIIADPGESTEHALQEVEAATAAEPEGPSIPAPVAAAEPSASSPEAIAEVRESPGETDEPVPAPGRLPSAPAAARRLFASPLVRRLARERGLDLATIVGSGPNGRIVRRDLDTAASAPQAPAPERDAARDLRPAPPAADRDHTDIPHSGMRRAIARRLTESKATVPHFYVVADCRVDELLALRERINEQADVKISVNDFVVKAVALAMRDVPEANAIWTDESTRRFTAVDIAIAVAVSDGLLTPVIRGVDRMSLGELSTTMRELAARARDARLRQHELEGGSFSVSNLGMYGTKEFSAIINPPHAGILAVGAATRRPVVADDGSLIAASVMTVTLSADHRVLDGAIAAQWLAAFVRRIENPLSILV
jgi:pyruvate dehydrogenase E2 component (dihydrolipoamide acetyltransferase)